ncbi:hypothetical protein L2E82_30430 [Cichorium intybus]|uniref:Uncharacterized protein n=1 Tax=Cichorium intybus TaxID=13427 RepID=A0ACB9D0C6_CICIN|nr:hypothetical protein L2E82_30430 [Cichorium intybus]
MSSSWSPKPQLASNLLLELSRLAPSMRSDASSSLFFEEAKESTGQKPNTHHNIDSIDYSLDAIEKQLSSITLNTSIDEETPSIADDHYEPVSDANVSSREMESKQQINSTGESNLSRETGVWRNGSEVEVDGATLSPPQWVCR